MNGNTISQIGDESPTKIEKTNSYVQQNGLINYHESLHQNATKKPKERRMNRLEQLQNALEIV